MEHGLKVITLDRRFLEIPQIRVEVFEEEWGSCFSARAPAR